MQIGGCLFSELRRLKSFTRIFWLAIIVSFFSVGTASRYAFAEQEEPEEDPLEKKVVQVALSEQEKAADYVIQALKKRVLNADSERTKLIYEGIEQIKTNLEREKSRLSSIYRAHQNLNSDSLRDLVDQRTRELIILLKELNEDDVSVDLLSEEVVEHPYRRSGEAIHFGERSIKLLRVGQVWNEIRLLGFVGVRTLAKASPDRWLATGVFGFLGAFIGTVVAQHPTVSNLTGLLIFLGSLSGAGAYELYNPKLKNLIFGRLLPSRRGRKLLRSVKAELALSGVNSEQLQTRLLESNTVFGCSRLILDAGTKSKIRLLGDGY